MQTLFEEIVQKISELTPEEKRELLRRLIELDKQIEEDKRQFKTAD